MQNFEKIYNERYKKLHVISFIITLVGLGVYALIDLLVNSVALKYPYEGALSFIVGTEASSSFVGALFIWSGIVVGMGFLVKFLVSIIISQKIVATEALLSIKKDKNNN